MSQASENSDSPSHGQAAGGAACGFDDLAGLVVYDLDVSEQAFREEERRLCKDFTESKRRKLELASIRRLRKEIGEVLFDCRQVILFQNWLDSPGREWLFRRYCSLAIAEWDDFAAKNQPPRAFKTGGQTVARHLAHCSFCRMACRLAEGRTRMRAAGLERLLRGDQIISDCAKFALAEAFFHATAPRGLPCVLTPGHAGEPTTITVLEQECERTNGQLKALARLEGGVPDVRVEVNVVWEPATADPPPRAVRACRTRRSASTSEGGAAPTERPSKPGCARGPAGSIDLRLPQRLAFPNERHPDSLVVVGADGSCLIPLVLPNSAAERGVVFKYCGYRVTNEGLRRLATLTPNAAACPIQTGPGVPGMASGGAEASGPGELAASPGALPDTVAVSVDAVSFQWAK